MHCLHERHAAANRPSLSSTAARISAAAPPHCRLASRKRMRCSCRRRGTGGGCAAGHGVGSGRHAACGASHAGEAAHAQLRGCRRRAAAQPAEDAGWQAVCGRGPVRRQAGRLARAVPGNKAQHRHANGAAPRSAWGAAAGTCGFLLDRRRAVHHPDQPTDASTGPRPAEAAAGLAGGVAHVARLVRGRQRVEQCGIRAQKLRRQPGGRGGRLRGCVHKR